MIKIVFADTSPLNDNSFFQKAYNLIPDFRQKKADKLKFREDKNLSVGVWLLLQSTLLSLGVDSAKICFDVTENGKPYIKSGIASEIYFSLSHSGNVALCAVSDMPIGADVEKIRDFNTDVCDKFMTKKEKESIMNQDNSEQQKEMFFRIWSLKESFVKMNGNGIAGFRKAEIIADGNGVYSPDAVNCTFHELCIGGYKAAVCCMSSSEIDVMKHTFAK